MSVTKEKKIQIRQWIGISFGAVFAVTVLAILLFYPRPKAEKKLPAENLPATTVPVLEPSNFSPEDFAYKGNYLTCLTQKSVLGIDVSSLQREIDWQQVKGAGVEFVMIRLAYRGSIQGLLEADSYAQKNYEGAKAAGLKVGGYIFTQAISLEEAKEDAALLLEVTKDWELDLPLVYDWEVIKPEYRNANVTKQTLTEMIQAFCDTVEAAGRQSMVYFNISQAEDNLFLEKLAAYDFWLADYSGTMDFPHRVDMWQYTNKGAVPGINGDVDINLYFPKE